MEINKANKGASLREYVKTLDRSGKDNLYSRVQRTKLTIRERNSPE